MIPQSAVDLIIEFEGIDQPSEWPGAKSGITLGCGYDLSAEDADELAHDWSPFLSADAIARLKTAVGKSGEAAHAIEGRFRDIRITRQAAEAVLLSATLPKYEAQTRRTFPGFDLLPGEIRGALLSLVFNRGTKLTGDRRREMRSIAQLIEHWSEGTAASRARDLPALASAVAGQFRSMIRLWIGTAIERGMRRRRQAEAALVETARAA